MKKLITILLLIPVLARGQYIAEASLSSVSKDGFYKISLSPAITAWLESDFRNIRIIDEKGREMPYILQEEKPLFNNVQFVQYTMEKKQEKGCCTTLTLINKEKSSINNIMLEVNNAETVKEATLRGSDDRETWYALKEHFQLGDTNDNRKTSQLQILGFPLSNYSFYQVVINDSTTAPLKVLQAGYYNVSTDHGVYIEIPDVSITSADSVKDHFTWGVIKFDTTQFIDKLEFNVSGPPFYFRGATLFQKEYYYQKKVRIEYLNPVTTFDISSRQEASVLLPSIKTNELLLRIANENNQPLVIKGIKAYQLKRSLTAWLAAGHEYKVVAGKDSLPAPVYDLEFFRDSIPAMPALLEMGNVKSLVKPVISSSPTYFTNRNIIWVAIVLVVVILGGMSLRMIRENEKGK